MLVYKFGGASVKDADGIRNLTRIVEASPEKLVIVVSALGKTTNALENVLKTWLKGDNSWFELTGELFKKHTEVVSSLGTDLKEINERLELSFSLLRDHLHTRPGRSYDFEYDQVVSFGEIWSTIIVAGYLNRCGIPAVWKDIRKYLVTDDTYRDANILWGESTEKIKNAFNTGINRIYLTQGFIGATASGFTTTLGREGSDYTAAVLGNILDAEKVIFWKDVPGILNADPKWMSEVSRLDQISYKEAVEMTFSGAKVIHPKTIKPLHNKNIPLNVRSFISPDDEGTIIKADVAAGDSVPIFIKKENQILISILPKDFSFAMGDNLSRIFHTFLVNGVKVNLVQASAVSINVCVDDERPRVEALMEDLRSDYKSIYNDNAEMLSIRHTTPEAIRKITEGREILLEQRTRRIARFVMKKVEN